MIIVPTNATKKGNVTFSSFGAWNSSNYSAGDLLIYFGYYPGYQMPAPTGWTIPSAGYPQFTNAYLTMAYKVATSSSESFPNIRSDLGAAYNQVMVLKNGTGLGGQGVTSLTYSGPYPLFAPGFNLQNTDGSSYVLYIEYSNILGVPTGVSLINPAASIGGYNFHYLTNTSVASTPSRYYGYQYQGMVAAYEIVNT